MEISLLLIDRQGCDHKICLRFFYSWSSRGECMFIPCDRMYEEILSYYFHSAILFTNWTLPFLHINGIYLRNIKRLVTSAYVSITSCEIFRPLRPLLRCLLRSLSNCAHSLPRGKSQNGLWKRCKKGAYVVQWLTQCASAPMPWVWSPSYAQVTCRMPLHRVMFSRV